MVYSCTQEGQCKDLVDFLATSLAGFWWSVWVFHWSLAIALRISQTWSWVFSTPSCLWHCWFDHSQTAVHYLKQLCPESHVLQIYISVVLLHVAFLSVLALQFQEISRSSPYIAGSLFGWSKRGQLLPSPTLSLRYFGVVPFESITHSTLWHYIFISPCYALAIYLHLGSSCGLVVRELDL